MQHLPFEQLSATHRAWSSRSCIRPACALLLCSHLLHLLGFCTYRFALLQFDPGPSLLAASAHAAQRQLSSASAKELVYLLWSYGQLAEQPLAREVAALLQGMPQVLSLQLADAAVHQQVGSVTMQYQAWAAAPGYSSWVVGHCQAYICAITALNAICCAECCCGDSVEQTSIKSSIYNSWCWCWYSSSRLW